MKITLNSVLPGESLDTINQQQGPLKDSIKHATDRDKFYMENRISRAIRLGIRRIPFTVDARDRLSSMADSGERAMSAEWREKREFPVGKVVPLVSLVGRMAERTAAVTSL